MRTPGRHGPRTGRSIAVGAAVGLAVILSACRGDDGSTPMTTTATAPVETILPATDPPTTGLPATEPPSSASPTSASPSSASPTSASPTSASTEPVPAAVTDLRGGAGGGSGELYLQWTAVAGATGYRVTRAPEPDGPFAVAAEVDVLTGAVTAVEGVTNLWSDTATYLPTAWYVPGSPPPTELHYVELVTDGAPRRYFRVEAYNAGGAGGASTVVCAAPPSLPPCP